MAEAAVGKRIKISKMQQHIILAVLGASLVFGVSVVFSIFFVKYIAFNSKVIEGKDKAIVKYYNAIKNVGICIDGDKDGKFTDAELDKCNPDDIKVTDIPGTLRYNIMIGTSENNNLESVARESLLSCYDVNGKKHDFAKMYQNAETSEERQRDLNMLKMCSSLRAVPDALPSISNVEALLASIDQIFNVAIGQSPDSLAPSTTSEISPIPELQVIPFSISIDKDIDATMAILNTMEISIRTLEFTSAKITWRDQEFGKQKLELNASALAFYTDEITASETQETVYATKEAQKKFNEGGGQGLLNNSNPQEGGEE